MRAASIKVSPRSSSDARAAFHASVPLGRIGLEASEMTWVGSTLVVRTKDRISFSKRFVTGRS